MISLFVKQNLIYPYLTRDIQFSRNTGKYLENIIFLELRRRYEAIFYYKTKNNLEVDFIIQKNKKIILLIQVCESLVNEKTRKRELTALSTAMNELGLKTGLILTMDETETITLANNKTVTVMPVYQWLLM